MSDDAHTVSALSDDTGPQAGSLCRYAPDAKARLQGFNFASLEESANPVLAVDADFCITYLNPAYLLFACENGSNPAALMAKFPVGANSLDAIGGVLRAEYEARFREVIATGVAWHHDYECSGPDVYRVFRQTVFPLASGGGLLLVNSLRVSGATVAFMGGAEAPVENTYLQSTGFLTQCSNCRRTQRSGDSVTWDWVPAWVESMPERMSHSICPPCFAHYWK